MDIRDRIRQLLKEQDVTPRAISIKAGLSDSMLTKFLNPEKRGGTRSMTIENLEKLAGAFEVNSRWLIFGDAPKLTDEKLVYIWERIAERQREQALKVLETFADETERDAG